MFYVDNPLMKYEKPGINKRQEKKNKRKTRGIQMEREEKRVEQSETEKTVELTPDLEGGEETALYTNATQLL